MLPRPSFACPAATRAPSPARDARQTLPLLVCSGERGTVTYLTLQYSTLSVRRGPMSELKTSEVNCRKRRGASAARESLASSTSLLVTLRSSAHTREYYRATERLGAVPPAAPKLSLDGSLCARWDGHGWRRRDADALQGELQLLALCLCPKLTLQGLQMSMVRSTPGSPRLVARFAAH